MIVATEKVYSSSDELKKSLEKAIVPGIPTELSEVYQLRYKKGQVTADLSFKWTSDQKDAEKVAREYCKRFNLRYIWVNKAYVDILSMPFAERDMYTEGQ